MGIIRFFLAVAVLLWHCPEGVVGRYIHPALAVQCFYAVSGFLMQMVIRNKYQGEPGWQRRFYMSRVLRLFPLYLLFVLLTVTLIGNGHLSYYIDNKYWYAVLIWILNNLLIVGQDVLRFFYFNLRTAHFIALPASDAARGLLMKQDLRGSISVLGQSWTLAIELYFYLLAPFLLTCRTRVLLILVPMLIALRFAIGYWVEFQPEWLYGFFPSELAIFLLGSLACRVYFYLFASGRLAGMLGEKTLLAIAAVSVIGACTTYITVHVGFGWGHFAEPPLGAPTGYWLVLLMTVATLPFAFHFSRSFAWDSYIGELSYPIYISHMLVLQLLTVKLQPTVAASRYLGLFVLITSVLLSMALIQFIEQPLDRLRHRLFHRSVPAVAPEEKVV